MKDWLTSWFAPPPFPDLGLGWTGRISGAQEAAAKAAEAAYWAGLAQGATAGVLACTGFLVACFVFRINPFRWIP